jgi:hypothetical protein
VSHGLQNRYIPTRSAAPVAEELEAFFGAAAEDCGSGGGACGFNLDYEPGAGEDPHARADRLFAVLAVIGRREVDISVRRHFIPSRRF